MDSQKTILIIDDEETLRSAMETALVYEGFNVVLANDGEEGIKKALEVKPDLIFLDIVMPKIDGIGVLKRLRNDEWGSTADIVVMTVRDDLEKIAEVMEEGGSEYILKTEVSLKDIVEKVKTHLSLS